MARTSLVVLTGAVGVAAIAAGAYVARRRRSGFGGVGFGGIGAAESERADRDWSGEDTLTEELANVLAEPSPSTI